MQVLLAFDAGVRGGPPKRSEPQAGTPAKNLARQMHSPIPMANLLTNLFPCRPPARGRASIATPERKRWRKSQRKLPLDPGPWKSCNKGPDNRVRREGIPFPEDEHPYRIPINQLTGLSARPYP